MEDLIAIVREYFPQWELPEDLSLDAETIHQLSSVIKHQSDWVRHRSTSLYTDPFLLEEKIRRQSGGELAGLFIRAWNPIVEMEQLSLRSLAEALSYWQSLLPLNERWAKAIPLEREMGAVTREELIRQRIMVEKAFSEELEALWVELKERVEKEGKGKIKYWDFIGTDTYEETVERAYMTSFLVTYGYATLEIHRLEEEVFLKPFEKPESLVGKKEVVSVPFSIGEEDWRKWKEGA